MSDSRKGLYKWGVRANRGRQGLPAYLVGQPLKGCPLTNQPSL